jgi:glutamyl-tRNA reductase
MVGLSHKNAPVEVRERWAFTAPGQLSRALNGLRERLRAEAVLLSTCNRTELYVEAETLPSSEALRALLTELHGDAPSGANPFEERRGHRAIEHLFRVTAGLESMILGESDIVRQVKEAYSAAAAAGLCGAHLNPLFHEAFRVAKRARTELDLSRGAFSVGHAAAEMAAGIFGDLAGRTVLILGAGEMSEATARHLTAAGAASVLVANRTYDRAVRLAETLGGRAVHWDEFGAQLVRADIVLASTAAPHAVVTRDLIEPVLAARRHRPLFLIDIALPRDIDPAVGLLDDVFLYDLDDLQQVVATDAAERQRRAVRADALVAQEAREVSARLRAAHTAGPLVSEVRAKHRAIVDGELSRLRQRLPDLTDDEWRAVETFAGTVLNKIAHDPTVKIREFAASDAPEKLDTVRELFALVAPPPVETEGEGP